MPRAKPVTYEVNVPKPEEPETEPSAGDDGVTRNMDLVLAQLVPQYTLPWEEQAKLIRSEQPLNQKGVTLAVQVARSFGLPLQGINVIASRTGVNVYVNSDGVRWRLHTDPRGITYSDAEVVHRATKDEPWIEVKATIVMGYGDNISTYVNYGVVDVKPGEAIGNATMKAVTKAKRRAGVDAVGVALPIFEDFVEYAQEAGILRVTPTNYEEGDYRPIAPKPEPANDGDPTTIPAFMAFATSLGITDPNEVLRIAEMADWTTIGNNLAQAVARLRAYKKP